MSADLLDAGVAAIADAVRAGEVGAEAMAVAALGRLEGAGRRFNAVVRIDRDEALQRARDVDQARAAGQPLGPLAGVPMAHKDLFYRAGRPAAFGSKIMRGFVAPVTATALTRLDEAGAVDCGTLHMAEFALGPTGDNRWDGPGLNPHDAAYASGGSSSGSAIAVAVGCVPAALGTDTGGSIRHPAAMCGLTGLKPTNGAISLAGAMPLAASLDCAGPIARRASDLTLLLDVLTDDRSPAASDRHDLRIAIPRGYYDDMHPAVAVSLDEAARVLVGLGVAAIETRAPDMAAIDAATRIVLAAEAATVHRTWLETRPEEYGDAVRQRIAPGLEVRAVDYLAALAARGTRAEAWIAAVLGEADAALLATIPDPVPTIAATAGRPPAETAALTARITRNTRAINYLGLPAVALPCGRCAHGMPIGMQLVGRPRSERRLLALAARFQAVTSWHLPRNGRRSPDG